MIAKDFILKCGQIFNVKKTQYRTGEYMLCTRDGLHFVVVSKDDKAKRTTFYVAAIDKSRTIFDGKEVREALEY